MRSALFDATVAGGAGHGARVRFGLTSHRPLGRAFATVAPFAAVLAGTYALLLAIVVTTPLIHLLARPDLLSHRVGLSRP
ncbi:hypothetical protein EH183_41905 [Streptomyces sp. CB01881]|uniref:hypothetical protein n=1 Tax=Streptomyces sp. CB01881 TaxID=2078691 RepID=UPI0011E05D53|nr:hypothetical protein [Streptomyces sp. CB01881]TYC66552.1 hypothetical protein EH183_41905 [Streptomyces sp. CB01881]